MMRVNLIFLTFTLTFTTISMMIMEHRFMNMNRQVCEFTSMVKVLTEKITNNREENSQSVQNVETSRRSDMVKGVSANPIPTSNLLQPRRTLSTPNIHQRRGTPQQFHEPQIDDVMTVIQNMRSAMTDGVLQPKILHTQVLLYRENCEKYNEFEHLLKTHFRPHLHKLTEEQKLNFCSEPPQRQRHRVLTNCEFNNQNNHYKHPKRSTKNTIKKTSEKRQSTNLTK